MIFGAVRCHIRTVFFFFFPFRAECIFKNILRGYFRSGPCGVSISRRATRSKTELTRAAVRGFFDRRAGAAGDQSRSRRPPVGTLTKHKLLIQEICAKNIMHSARSNSFPANLAHATVNQTAPRFPSGVVVKKKKTGGGSQIFR